MILCFLGKKQDWNPLHNCWSAKHLIKKIQGKSWFLWTRRQLGIFGLVPLESLALAGHVFQSWELGDIWGSPCTAWPWPALSLPCQALCSFAVDLALLLLYRRIFLYDFFFPLRNVNTEGEIASKYPLVPDLFFWYNSAWKSFGACFGVWMKQEEIFLLTKVDIRSFCFSSPPSKVMVIWNYIWFSQVSVLTSCDNVLFWF